jgi:integrase
LKEAIVLTPEQFREIVPKLPEHMTSACLGLRVSEALGLQWSDIDWEHGTVTIRRSAYRGSIDETKNTPSKARCCYLQLHLRQKRLASLVDPVNPLPETVCGEAP